MLATDGERTAIPWAIRRSEIDKVVAGELSVLPRLAGVAPGHVRLELALRDTRSPADAVQTSLMLRDQQSVVVNTAANSVASSQALVVTPYVVRDDEDLRRLLQCKEQARHEATLKR